MKSIISILVVVVIVNEVKAQNQCPKEPGETKICVPVGSCKTVLDIHNNYPKKIPDFFIKYLRRQHCDFRDQVHYICCSESQIIKNEVDYADSASGDQVDSGDNQIDSKPNSNNTFENNSNQTTDTSVQNNTIDNIESRAAYDKISGHPSLELFNSLICGRIDYDRVANGNNTELGEFPWMARLEYRIDNKPEFKCGGSLISPQYVLTAAHCVIRREGSPISVRLGEYDTDKDEDCSVDGDCMPPVQDIEIESFSAHPGYNKPRFANDIAVIRLKQPANLQNDNVSPICLPITEKLQYSQVKRMTIAGWGLTEKKKPSNILQKAILPVVPNNECQRLLGRRTRITPSQMCAGGAISIESCNGDSGGPLFFNENYSSPSDGRLRQRYVQYGIVSFGLIGCGNQDNIPEVYTNVPFYMKWILDQMRN